MEKHLKMDNQQNYFGGISFKLNLLLLIIYKKRIYKDKYFFLNL